jgi:hypothetical protein
MRQQTKADTEHEARPLDAQTDSIHTPGVEFPKAVYRSVVAAFGFILVASWATFGGSDDSDLALAFATVLTIVFFALPIIIRKSGALRSADNPARLDEFLHSSVETATGRLTGAEAWLQVLIIPLTLAFAAIAIGAVYVIVA